MRIDPSCAFCAIAVGRDRSVDIVCEEPLWLAFFPTAPATPGHTLVIPRAHIPDLWQADSVLGEALMRGAIRVGRAIGDALAPDGMNLITSAGSAAEQTVFHLHLHVVPRWRTDPIGPIWPPKERMTELLRAELADMIRKHCAVA